MTADHREHAWLEECKSCGQKHRYKAAPCPSCRTQLTAQPVSEAVQKACRIDYDCEGCRSYREHLR